MGAWGYYDDQNDRTHDLIVTLENLTLPKHIQKLKLYEEKSCGKKCATVYDTKETIQNNNIRKKWLLNNFSKIQTTLKKLIKENKDITDSEIAGVALYMVKKWGKLRKINKSNVELVPPWLKKRAKKASLNQLQKGDFNEWKCPKTREKMLQAQVKLFSTM